MPKMGFAGAVELFFVVAMTDAIGGEAISKRVREQLAGCELIQQAGLTLSTSYRLLEPVKRYAGESMEDLVENIATRLQEQMNKEISSRIVKNG